MMSHKPQTKWQTGILPLFGYIDPIKWSVLWCLAEFADEGGFVEMRDQDVADAMVRDVQRVAVGIKSTMKRMIKEDGLIKVVRKSRWRMWQDPSTGYYYRDFHIPRVIQLYPGLEFGLLPPGEHKIDGLVPYYHYKGGNPTWQTHKLFRQKFKPKKIEPEFKDYRHLSKWELQQLVPSAALQRKYEKQRVEKENLRHARRNTKQALKRRWRI